MAEIAHQSGNRSEQVNALQSAYGQAYQNNDQNLISRLAGQLQGLGVVPGNVPQAPAPLFPSGAGSGGFAPMPPVEITRHGGETEMDPVKRLRIEQFSREAEAFMRGGSPERAVETYKKALELDPGDLTIIEAIVAVHRTTGRLTQVQMQFVQSAGALALIGKKREAAHLLDLAEELFPGSTRIHRRSLGLPEKAPQAPQAPPASRAIPMPAPAPIPLPAPPPPAAPDLDMAIELDMPRFETHAPSAPQRQAPAPLPTDPFSVPVQPSAPSEFEALPVTSFDLMGTPSAPAAQPASAAFEPEALDASDLSWMEETLTNLPPSEFLAPAPEAAPAFQSPYTQELPPSPTERLAPEVVEALSLPSGPEPATVPETFVELTEDLVNHLGDIDFQLDYGSPDEAKIEIEMALKTYPNHPELLERLQKAEAALEKLGLHSKAGALEESDFTNSFFDLTDVLGTAMADSGEGEEMHDATHVVEKIQSVDELFSAFREGVEKQVKGDDYDTHYNLGIAYKEMMLIDPAIEEFKVAMGDPERTLECCSMLSICEQARGDLDKAVEWLVQGIEAPGFPPDDSIGLRYDLAEIYLQQGKTGDASREFKLVYDMDSDYRDVAARLA
jgi:tetratricopeptide (TPR) repeat protein